MVTSNSGNTPIQGPYLPHNDCARPRKKMTMGPYMFVYMFARWCLDLGVNLMNLRCPPSTLQNRWQDLICTVRSKDWEEASMGMRASHEARDECKTLIPIITLFGALTCLKSHYNVACKTDDHDIVWEERRHLNLS
jgi:hypothetical protein